MDYVKLYYGKYTVQEENKTHDAQTASFQVILFSAAARVASILPKIAQLCRSMSGTNSLAGLPTLRTYRSVRGADVPGMKDA